MWPTGWATGPIGAAVAAWPAVALVGSYELLMMVIRSSQTASDGTPDDAHAADPLQEQAAEIFADQGASRGFLSGGEFAPISTQEDRGNFQVNS
jgi:hypothetical protein